MSVFIGPAITAWTFTPRGASNARSDCESDNEAALEIEYDGMIGRAAAAAVERRLTTVPLARASGVTTSTPRVDFGAPVFAGMAAGVDDVRQASVHRADRIREPSTGRRRRASDRPRARRLRRPAKDKMSRRECEPAANKGESK